MMTLRFTLLTLSLLFLCTFVAPKPMSMNSPDGKQESEIINSDDVPSYFANRLPDVQSNKDDEPIKVIEIQVVPDQEE